MLFDSLLAILGPAILGGALAYAVWSRVDPTARAARKAKAAARKADDPPLQAQEDEAAAKAPAPLVLPAAEPQGLDAVGVPQGTDPGPPAEPAQTLSEPADVAALRDDVAELASSLIAVHETIAAQPPQPDPQIAERLDALTALIDALLPADPPPPVEVGPPDLSDQLAPILQRLDQLGTALTSSIAGLPGEVERSVSTMAPPVPDLSPVTTRIADLETVLRGGLEQTRANFDNLAAALPPDPAPQLATLEAQLSDVSGRLAQTDEGAERLTALSSALDDLRHTTRALAANAAEVPDLRAYVEEDLAAQVAALHARVELIGAALAGVGRRLGAAVPSAPPSLKADPPSPVIGLSATAAE